MVSIVYSGALLDELGTAFEHPHLPASVKDVDSLLQWLRRRGPRWERALGNDGVQVTVNKRAAAGKTAVTDADEIAVAPISLRTH